MAWDGNRMTLGLDYRWRPGVGLEAKYSDSPDADHYWRKSLLPSVDAAAAVPGELEKMIAARDMALPLAPSAGDAPIPSD